MKENTISYALIGLLAGVLIGVFASSYAVNNNMSGMMNMMGIRLSGYSGTMMGNANSLDQHFIEH